MPTPTRLPSRRYTSFLLVLAITVLLTSACSGDGDPTATPSPTSAPAADIPAPSTPTPGATAPAPSPVPTSAPDALTLEVLSPQDGAGVEIGAVRVLGRTRPDAVVGVNGTPVTPEADGSFQHDVLLEPGPNLIEVVATDVSGAVQSRELAVFAVAPTAALPLSLFYPPDGVDVDQPSISVIGGSRQDAIVGVNGTPVEINSLGIFATEVPLESGANLIEVVAADINDNVAFQTVVVFRTP